MPEAATQLVDYNQTYDDAMPAALWVQLPDSKIPCIDGSPHGRNLEEGP